MKKTVIRLVLFLLFVFISSPLLAINADDINKAIRDQGAGWVAEETPISKLSPEEAKSLFGLKPGKRLGLKPKSDRYYAEEVLPAKIDWRNVDGHSYVSSVKNQGHCGGCYAFASTAALESRIMITSQTPDANLNLSEQSMISCDPRQYGCGGGFLDYSMEFLRDTGAPLESCYPFTAEESGETGDCAGCTDWRQNTYRVTSFEDVSNSVELIKSALLHNGPVLAGFLVYKDFLYYKSGVYRHVTNMIVAGHAVTIVGYDDEEQCWIVKNSMGPAWGENGFFKIAMGVNECNIESEVYTIDYAVVPGASFVLSPSSIDFGMLLLPDNPFQTFSFTITNNGSLPLSDISFDVTNAKFVVSEPGGSPIESAGSQDIEVTYAGLGELTPDTAELNVSSSGVTRSIILSGQANTRPDQPVNLWPPDGWPIVMGQTVTLSASEFEDEDGDTHGASRWIIQNSSGGVVHSGSFDLASKTSFTVPSGTLQADTRYYWQVIYRDDRGAESQPSTLTSFTTGRSASGGSNCFITAAATDSSIKGQYVTGLFLLSVYLIFLFKSKKLETCNREILNKNYSPGQL